LLRRFPGDDDPLDAWSYAPPDDTARAAAEIRRRFGWPAPAKIETN
jgi:mitochondrial fission protein ELM1